MDRLRRPVRRIQGLLVLLAVGVAGCASSGPQPPPAEIDPGMIEAQTPAQTETATAAPTPQNGDHSGSANGAPPRETVASEQVGPAGEEQEPERRWGDRYWGVGGERVLQPLVQPRRQSELHDPLEPLRTTTGWLRYKEWIGDGSTRTEPFTTRSDWKLVWRSGGRASSQPLEIVAHRLPGDAVVARVSQDGASDISSLQLPESGTYYLAISGGGGVWYVAVDLPGGQP